MAYLKKLTSLIAIFSIAYSPIFAEGHMDHQKGTISHPQKKYVYMPERCTNFFFYGAYTYWQAYQQNSLIVSVGNNGAQGNVIYPNDGYRNGFKVGLGANNTFDGWYFGATYTWFYNFPGVRTNNLISGQNYFTAFTANPVVFTSCASKFVNSFNRVDALFDKDFYSGKYFTFRPWIGFLGAWEHSKLYMEGATTEAPLRRMELKQQWYGVGPYSGFGAMCNCTESFALFVNPGLAMLFANHSLSNDQQTLEAEGGTTYNVLYPKNYFNIEPMVEISLGFSFNMDYHNFSANIKAAWEMQTYLFHNGFQGFFPGMGVDGPYSMNGLTVGLRLGF